MLSYCNKSFTVLSYCNKKSIVLPNCNKSFTPFLKPVVDFEHERVSVLELKEKDQTIFIINTTLFKRPWKVLSHVKPKLLSPDRSKFKTPSQVFWKAYKIHFQNDIGLWGWIWAEQFEKMCKTQKMSQKRPFFATIWFIILTISTLSSKV